MRWQYCDIKGVYLAIYGAVLGSNTLLSDVMGFVFDMFIVLKMFKVGWISVWPPPLMGIPFLFPLVSTLPTGEVILGNHLVYLRVEELNRVK